MNTLNEKKRCYKDGKYLISIFLVSMISLNLILGTIIYYRYRGEVLEELTRIETESQQADRFSDEMLRHKFQDLTKVIVSISNAFVVKGVLEEEDSAYCSMITENFMHFLKYDDEIIEIALISDLSEPIIAVSKQRGIIQCFSRDEFDVSYYDDDIKDIKDSQSGQLYFSNLKLAKTHVDGEAHLEPVIRFGMMVNTPNRNGYVFISLSGVQLLDEISSYKSMLKIQSSILIDDGKWLMDSVVEGATIRPSVVQYKDFKRYYPMEWEQIQADGKEVFFTDHGYFGTHLVNIEKILDTLDIDTYTEKENGTFYILNYVPQARIREIKEQALKELLFIPVTAFVTVIAVSMILALVMNRERQNRVMLKYEAERDALTGLYNRREGLVILENMLHISKRQHQPLILAYIDIDNLKEVNDTYGHNEGDFLIKKVTELAQLSHRESDVLARVGGDEFIMILPDCVQKDANLVFQRIQDSITEFNEKETRGYAIQISYGLAYYHGGDIKIENLIQEADEAMYKVKMMKMKRDQG